VFAGLVVRVELTIRCFHPRFLSSFPGARGPPLSRHLIPIRGCAAHRLELSGDGGSRRCRLVWAGAFPASFQEGLGIDLGGDGRQVFALPRAWGTALVRAWYCGFRKRAEGGEVAGWQGRETEVSGSRRGWEEGCGGWCCPAGTPSGTGVGSPRAASIVMSHGLPAEVG